MSWSELKTHDSSHNVKPLKISMDDYDKFGLSQRPIIISLPWNVTEILIFDGLSRSGLFSKSPSGLTNSE